MTTIAHTLSASYIAYTFTLGFNSPTLSISILLASILPAALLDLDHLYFAVRYPTQFRKWQRELTLHHARSWLHEILGLTAIFILCAIISIFGYIQITQAILISFSIHLAQDMIVGKSRPLLGINPILIKLFNFTFLQKVLIDLITILIFGALWIILLKNLLG